MNDFNASQLIMYHCAARLAARSARHAPAAWRGVSRAQPRPRPEAFPEATPRPTCGGTRAHTVVIFRKRPHGTRKQSVSTHAPRLAPSERGWGLRKGAPRALSALFRGRGAGGFPNLSSLMMKTASRRAPPVA